MIMAPEERELATVLPADGINMGGLHISVHRWEQGSVGRIFPVEVQEQDCWIWLEEQSWQGWCENTLGTTSTAYIDPLLFAGLSEWALLPLLDVVDAQPEYGMGEPVLCSLLADQLAVTFSWQVEETLFHAVLMNWPGTFFTALSRQLPPRIHQEMRLLPVLLPCYIGCCLVSIKEMKTVQPGTGLRLVPFGDIREGEGVVPLTTDQVARISLQVEDGMEINELVQDMESLLAEEFMGEEQPVPLAISVDDLPQKLLVEVGQLTVTPGVLKTLSVGDFLPADVQLSSQVKLRLNGQTVGCGELIGCGEHFLVRISQWYLATSGEADTVNT